MDFISKSYYIRITFGIYENYKSLTLHFLAYGTSNGMYSHK